MHLDRRRHGGAVVPEGDRQGVIFQNGLVVIGKTPKDLQRTELGDNSAHVIIETDDAALHESHDAGDSDNLRHGGSPDDGFGRKGWRGGGERGSTGRTLIENSCNGQGR